MPDRSVGLALAAVCALLGGCTGDEDAPGPAQFMIVDARAAPDHAVRTVDSEGRAVDTLFSAPPFSQVHQAVLAPDGRYLVMAYTPPPRDGTGFFDHSAIYRIDLADDDAPPERWFGATDAGTFLLEPAFSPDGSAVYFVRVDRFSLAGPSLETINLERYDTRSGTIERLIPNAIWPRVSPDGRVLTFVGVDPLTRERGLFVAGPDGAGLRELVPIGAHVDIDTPVFSADSRWVYFTIASEKPGASLFRWQGLVATAHAHGDHNIPSQWWRIAVDGGRPEAMGSQRAIILHGDRAPDAERLVYSTREGVFLQPLPVGDRRRLLPKGDYGTVQWLP